MTGDAGDYISGGRTYSYTPQTGARGWAAGGTETYAWMGVDYADDWWGATFEAPDGQILLPGHDLHRRDPLPLQLRQRGPRRQRERSRLQHAHREVHGARGGVRQRLPHRLPDLLRAALRRDDARPARRGVVARRRPERPDPRHHAPRARHRPQRRCRWRGGPADLGQPDRRRLGRHRRPRRQRHLGGHRGQAGLRRAPHLDGGHRLPDLGAVHPDRLHRGHVREPQSRAYGHHPGHHRTPAGTAHHDLTGSEPVAVAVAVAQPVPLAVAGSDNDRLTDVAPQVLQDRRVALQATRLSRREVRFTGRSGAWAAGAKGRLQRKGAAGWTTVATKRLSPTGTVRWRLGVPARPAARFRLVTRVDGQSFTSPAVRVKANNLDSARSLSM